MERSWRVSREPGVTARHIRVDALAATALILQCHHKLILSFLSFFLSSFPLRLRRLFLFAFLFVSTAALHYSRYSPTRTRHTTNGDTPRREETTFDDLDGRLNLPFNQPSVCASSFRGPQSCNTTDNEYRVGPDCRSHRKRERGKLVHASRVLRCARWHTTATAATRIARIIATTTSSRQHHRGITSGEHHYQQISSTRTRIYQCVSRACNHHHSFLSLSLSLALCLNL